MTDTFDVVIVGGGLVGMSLAAALEGSALRTLMIEAQASATLAQSWDERHFAIGRSSVERLRGIDAWPQVLGDAAIREVHVSRAGEFGRVLLRAEDMGLDYFGVTVPARSLVSALEQKLARCVSVQRWLPARLLDATPNDDAMRLRIARVDGEQTLDCRLIVAADGTDSALRSQRAIATQHLHYAQTAIVCAAETELPHAGRAFERFTDQGPIAALPLSGNRCGMVCTLESAAAESALALNDADYMSLLQYRFGRRLGRFLRVGRRQAWPLRLVVADQVVAERMVLIGNAAQTIHPIGAQGFNLGLRDASALAQVLRASPQDAGSANTLDRYAAARASDRAQTIHMTNAILRLSGGGGPVLQALRGLAMAMFDRVPTLSTAIARSAMGYRNMPA